MSPLTEAIRPNVGVIKLKQLQAFKHIQDARDIINAIFDWELKIVKLIS